MPQVAHDLGSGTVGRTGGVRTKGPAGLVARGSVAIATVFMFSLVFASSGSVPSVMAQNDPAAQISTSLVLAQAFTTALNAHDVDELVSLFSEDGPGATVHADRYAWTTFEIRLWAQHQVRANIRADVDEYQITDHGAAWNATVYRDDWRDSGMESVPLLNSIWVEDGKIMDFTSKLANLGDAERLAQLWRPGSLPDPAR